MFFNVRYKIQTFGATKIDSPFVSEGHINISTLFRQIISSDSLKLKMKPKAVIIEGSSNKKVYFGDAGEIVAKKKVAPIVNVAPKVAIPEEDSEPTNKPYSKFSKKNQQNDIKNLEKKWFEMVIIIRSPTVNRY